LLHGLNRLNQALGSENLFFYIGSQKTSMYELGVDSDKCFSWKALLRIYTIAKNALTSFVP